MRDFIETTNIDMWDIVESRYEFLKIMVDGIVQPEVKSLQTKEERKRHLIAPKVNGSLLTHLLQMNMSTFLLPNG